MATKNRRSAGELAIAPRVTLVEKVTSDGKIAVSEMDDAVFAEATKRHKLKGFQKEGFLSDMVVVETPKNIRHFIKEHADKMFPGKKPLSRLSIERMKQE